MLRDELIDFEIRDAAGELVFRGRLQDRVVRSDVTGTLSFSFMILAAVLAWEGYRTQRGDRGPDQQGKMYGFYATAAVCFGLGLRGVRERHRLLDEQDAAARRNMDDHDRPD